MNQHQTVLQATEAQPLPDLVVFGQVVDPDDLAVEQFTMKRTHWDDMGQPEYVTITVEPGDLLNA